MRYWLSALLPIASVMPGCAVPPPEPLEPVAVAAKFQAGSLSDPGLLAYLEAHGLKRGLPVPPASWDLPSLTLVAFYYHPDLDVARSRLELAQAAEVTAGARPNPRVGAGLQRNFDVLRGVSPWTYAFDFALPIELGGKRGERQARALYLSEAARLELAETGWRVRSRARGALAEHLLALREREALGTEEAARSRAVVLMEQRLVAGAVSQPDVDSARLDAARTRLESLSAQAHAEESHLQLAATLGLPSQALAGVSFVWADLDRPPGEEALFAADAPSIALVNRLDLRRLLAEHAAAAAALRLEVAKRWPDLDLGPGYIWEEEQRKLSLGFSLTVPLFHQNQGPIAEAVARCRQIAAEFQALQAAVSGEIAVAAARYRSAHRELEEAEQLLTLSERAERVTRRAVELGQEDQLALAGRQVESAVAARARLAALRKVQAALGALEDAVERPLAPADPPPEVNPRSPRDGGQEEDGT
jgi:outer membrane protein TolC